LRVTLLNPLEDACDVGHARFLAGPASRMKHEDERTTMVQNLAAVRSVLANALASWTAATESAQSPLWLRPRARFTNVQA
jgi:hypothetical protein